MTSRSKPGQNLTPLDDDEDTLDEVGALFDELTEPTNPHLLSSEESGPPADEDLTVSFLREVRKPGRRPSALNSVMRYLRANATHHTVRRPPNAWTARELVELADLSCPFVRSILVRLDGGLYLCVLPEDAQLDLVLLQMNLGATRASYVPLRDVSVLCPGFDPAHLPPLGPLLGQQVLLSSRLVHEAQLSFRLDPLGESVSLKTADFLRLSQARIVPMT